MMVILVDGIMDRTEMDDNRPVKADEGTVGF
jgi:hypothetical protein